MVEIVQATVGAILRAGEGGTSVLLLRRRPDDRSYPGAWCFPGGRIDPLPDGGFEDPAEALIREVEEEAGLIAEVSEFIGIFDSPLSDRGRIYRIHCFILAAPLAPVRLSNEHTEALWIGRHDPPPVPLAGPVTRWLLDAVFGDG